jgi:tRNA dimethylallyltransferase
MTDGKAAPVVFIAGPTASGKSAAALALAEAHDAEIVNADALQVYRDLDILTARPSPDSLSRAPHHLYGFVDAADRFSAGRWARAAAAAIEGIAARGRPAVIVGGSGLYFRALAEGLSPAPEIPAEVRAAARDRLQSIGLEEFRAELLARDPAAARLSPGDAQRHVRAFEVLAATGRPLSAHQSAPRAPIAAAPRAVVVIEPEREGLYRVAEMRFERMLAAGALDEARALLARGLDPDLPAMKALGAAELMAHLRGEISLAEAVDLAKRNTRRFIKRQLTWFRGQTPEWPRAADPEAAAAALSARLSRRDLADGETPRY